MPLAAAPITELTTLTAPKDILREWLAGYFDGGAHAVGLNAPVLFPACELQFAITRESQPLTTGCSIRLTVVRRMEKNWLNSDQTHGEHRRIQSAVGLYFWIKAAVQGKGEASELLASKVAQLLKALLTNPDEKLALAQRGIFQLAPQEPESMLAGSGYAEYLVPCSAEFHYPSLFNTGGIRPVDPASGTEPQSVAFVREDSIPSGEYLLGLAAWTVAMTLKKVVARAQASQTAATVFELELNGALTGVQISLAANVLGNESSNTTSPNFALPANAVARWKCVSAPAAVEDSAWLISLAMEVVPA